MDRFFKKFETISLLLLGCHAAVLQGVGEGTHKFISTRDSACRRTSKAASIDHLPCNSADCSPFGLAWRSMVWALWARPTLSHGLPCLPLARSNCCCSQACREDLSLCID